jgi:hypothetical protein
MQVVKGLRDKINTNRSIIQGLQTRVKELNVDITTKSTSNAELKRQIDELTRKSEEAELLDATTAADALVLNTLSSASADVYSAAAIDFIGKFYRKLQNDTNYYDKARRMLDKRLMEAADAQAKAQAQAEAQAKADAEEAKADEAKADERYLPGWKPKKWASVKTAFDTLGGSTVELRLISKASSAIPIGDVVPPRGTSLDDFKHGNEFESTLTEIYSKFNQQLSESDGLMELVEFYQNHLLLSDTDLTSSDIYNLSICALALVESFQELERDIRIQNPQAQFREDRIGRMAPNNSKTLTYLTAEAELDGAAPDHSAIHKVTLASDTIRRKLELIGRARFDTRFIRNIFFITNVTRLIRLKLHRELSHSRGVLRASHSAVDAAVTEYGEDPFSPNEVWTSKQRTGRRTVARFNDTEDEL